MTGSGTDCAGCRALLVENQDRAYREVRHLRPGERAACARACRRLAELCDDAAAHPTWVRSEP